MNWGDFEQLFQKMHLSKRYFDSKEKGFYELRPRQMLDDELFTKFLESLRYVPYLKDEKEKVQRFINGLPQSSY